MSGREPRRGMPPMVDECPELAHLPHAVYEIRFASGRVYVGRTGKSPADRLRAHVTHPARAVGRELRESPIVARAATAAEAARIEAHRLAAVPDERRVNVWIAHGARGSNRRPARTYERVDDATPVRCSWCRRLLPAAQFFRDRSRSSGVGSRCAGCSEIRSRWRRRELGLSAEEAYRAAKAEATGRAAERAPGGSAGREAGQAG